MIDTGTLARWGEWAKRDDWHQLFVGSDIRQMLGEIDRLRRQAEGLPPPIESNMIVPPPMPPGTEHVLDRIDDAAVFEEVGAPVATAKYRRPKDPRVQATLNAAERAQQAAADAAGEPARKIYKDPRLDPGWRAKK